MFIENRDRIMDYAEFLGKLREVPYKWHFTGNQRIRSGRIFSYGPITAVCKIMTGMDYREDSFSELASAVKALKLSPEMAKKITDAGNNRLLDKEVAKIRRDLIIATKLIYKEHDFDIHQLT